MSNDNGLLDEVKRWLEFDGEVPEDKSPIQPTIDELQERLAMEDDPEKRKALKSQIQRMEIASEKATLPTNITGNN